MMTDLYCRVCFILALELAPSILHSGLQSGLPGEVRKGNTIFWPPGPVPFRYEMVKSASLIFKRGGSGFSPAAVGVEREKSRTRSGCGCGCVYTGGSVLERTLGVTEGTWTWTRLSRPRSIARAFPVCL